GAGRLPLSRRGARADDATPTVAEAIERERRAVPAADPRARPPAAPARPARPQVALDASIFRAYDIRGVVGKTLDAGVAHRIGRAIGSEARERGLGDFVVGRDGRVSGPELAAALIDGLRASGV